MIKTMENLRRIDLMAAPILVLGIFGVLIWAFSGTSEKKENGETAPADAVENFHSLLLSGKWDEAEAMCGSGMDRYISSFREEWEMNMTKDSSVLEAAVRILREQGITVTGTSKGKDGKYFVAVTAKDNFKVGILANDFIGKVDDGTLSKYNPEYFKNYDPGYTDDGKPLSRSNKEMQEGDTLLIPAENINLTSPTSWFFRKIVTPVYQARSN